MTQATNTNGNSHADGLENVPYDNYPALLHEGERVLTAREARQESSTPINVTITGNSFTVRSDDDISELADQVASAFAEKFRRVARVMG
jgi:hypothetical protein